ncbi:redox-active disulfide protein 2 [Aquimarina sp. 2304DJ70-9]|uniref:redox-active disulfide protein 2 n=1 Tax=Aquimarina penaris TaxID=3231044 RepID=UPI003461AB8D
MKKEDLKKLSTEELLKKSTALKTVTSLLAGVLIVLLGVTVFNSIKTKTLDMLLVIPIALSTILFINYKQIKDIKTEIKSR